MMTKSIPAILEKTVVFDCKDVSDKGDFEGYASLFNIEDLGGDTVIPGAFADTLKKRGAGGIKMLAHHDRRDIIGVWAELKEDGQGLFASGKLFLDDDDGRKIHTRMKAGALDGLSIGYRIKAEEITDRQAYKRNLIKLDLFEISVVSFPMQDEARISAVKGDPLTERELERILTRDAGFTRSQAHTIINDGYKALNAKRDAGDGQAGLLDAVRQATESIKRSTQTIRSST